MPPPYRSPHWPVFSAVGHTPAGPIGHAPAAWARSRSLAGVPVGPTPLPGHKLDRASVRSICINAANPVLFGYVCAMAWGGQGGGPGAVRHVASAWSARAKIAAHLTKLRAGGLSRCAAYDLFVGSGAVPGLGPSYFTKLIYFFSPSSDFYIMDQWTAKSIALLTGQWVVRMAVNDLSTLNKCGNYQAYCEEVDAIAHALRVPGADAEEMMMSKGGHKPWPWRAHVRASWPIHSPATRYNAKTMRTTYPHIPAKCL